ncbi:MAG: DUF58 domain-containing protein [Alphaproteobacteria bacterium]
MAAPSQESDAAGRVNALRRPADALSGVLPALMLQAEQIANTLSHGEHGRRRSGIGEAFWQFRHYSPGDAANKIDWRQSAKSQSHFVRENEWQGAQSVWLWCDRSPSMNYRSAFTSHSKQERALVLTLALASLLTRGGERTGLLRQGGPPPGSGRAACARLAENLVLLTPEEHDLPAMLPLPRFARLVLMGDFLSPLEETAAIVHAYAAKDVQGHLLQVLDPAEEDLPFAGRIRFEGMQGEGNLTVGRVEDVRSAYHHRIRQHQDGLRAHCRRSGWSFAAHRTDHPPQLALLALYQLLSGSTHMGR